MFALRENFQNDLFTRGAGERWKLGGEGARQAFFSLFCLPVLNFNPFQINIQLI